MKVGDLIQYNPATGGVHIGLKRFGTVIEFPPARHAKEFQKVKVLTEEGIEDWVMQFCKMVENESR